MYTTFLSPEEEGYRTLGCAATFSWSRALTHPPRCNQWHNREVWDLMVAIFDRKLCRHWSYNGPYLLYCIVKKPITLVIFLQWGLDLLTPNSLWIHNSESKGSCRSDISPPINGCSMRAAS